MEKKLPIKKYKSIVLLSHSSSFIILTIVTIAILGFIIYSNTLHSSFHFDDTVFIVENPTIWDMSNLKAIWNAFNTRFLVGFSFALNYSIGELDVLGYHVVNITIHALSSLFVYFLVILTFLTEEMKKSPLNKKTTLIAFFSALIFLTHPIQTQGVTYITQRAGLLATLFYLMALVTYIKARLSTQPFYFLAAFLSTILGTLTKEMSVTIPLMLAVYEFFFFGPLRENGRQRFMTILPFFVTFIIIPWLLVHHPPRAMLDLGDQIASCRFDPNHLFTSINILRTYLRLLFFPIKQNVDYDYPIAQGFFEPSTFLSFLLLVIIFILAFFQFKKSRLISFCIIWFFIAASVELVASTLIGRDLIFEHHLYLPMVGFSILVAVIFFSWLMDTRKIVIALCILVSIYSLLTYQRNKVWQNEFTLWQDAINKSPHKGRPYVNLGVAYSRNKEYGRAIPYFEKGILLDPQNAQIYINLGTAYGREGEYDKSIAYNQKAIAIDPKRTQAYNNIGLAYADKGDYDKALAYCLESIQIDSNYAPAYNNLGLVYGRKGDYRRALSSFEEAIKLNPRYAVAYKNLGFAYAMKGEYGKAIEYYERSIHLDSKDPESYNNLGFVYGMKGNHDRAIELFEKALELKPDYGQAHRNLVSAHLNRGDAIKPSGHSQEINTR